MGRNSRHRHAEKARRRARERIRQTPRPDDTGDGNEHGYADTVLALSQLIRHRAAGGRSQIGIAEFRSHPEIHQRRAIDARLAFVVNALFDAGWTPSDLYEVARRKTERSVVRHLLDVAAEQTARHPVARVHPDWSAQLSALGARLPNPIDGSASAAWARRLRLAWPDAVVRLVDLFAIVCALPPIEMVLPRPGSPSVAASSGSGIDERVLRKVRALLAKAESTEFEDEADALTAKAQQLMTQHSIDQTLAESHRPRIQPTVRRLWIDNPYQLAKALLVSAVADANHCRTIISDAWGFLTVVGLPSDLDVVELLSTSLLVQATRAMTLAGTQTTRSGVSRTRSFRQSFLAAYADRIAERLSETTGSAEAAADSAHGGALLPVLVARDRAVDNHFSELFPKMLTKGVSASNGTGWAAGRAAADLARFDIRDRLDGRAG